MLKQKLTRSEFLIMVSSSLLFRLDPYGRLFRNTWPTREQGMISSVPPHIQTLKESSKFSPPQTFIPGSYSPKWWKYSLSMANSPPAIVGDLKGLAKSSSFCNSDLGMGSHLKLRPQLKPEKYVVLLDYFLSVQKGHSIPPRTSGDGSYLKVSALTISMIGVTTLVLSSLILWRRGSSQCTLAST